jgi:hypothetical protein
MTGDEINELLNKIVSAKWLVSLFVLALLTIFVWKNFDFLTEVSITFTKDVGTKQTAEAKSTETSGKKGKKKTEEPQPGLSLGEILIPPAAKTLPAFAVFEITNPGSAPTHGVRVAIDFGGAKVSAYEVIGPNDREAVGSRPGQSVVNVDIVQLRPGESAYIYAQLTQPGFKKITLSSNDTAPAVVEYTFNNYLQRKRHESSITFLDFLLILIGLFIFVMSIWGTVALIFRLNRWLKL